LLVTCRTFFAVPDDFVLRLAEEGLDDVRLPLVLGAIGFQV
jgi:hypothetical protein